LDNVSGKNNKKLIIINRKEELGNEDKDEISVVDNSNKWIDNSLLPDIIKEECKDLPKIAETDYLQFVETKGIYTLKQWKDLTEEQKDNRRIL
jgi:hypothetical protein